MSWKNYLHEIYYNPKNAGSFLGPDELFRYVRKDGKYVISKKSGNGCKNKRLIGYKDPYGDVFNEIKLW